MKLFNLIWVLALARHLACNSRAAPGFTSIDGRRPSSAGTGGAAARGGTGGGGGACTDARRPGGLRRARVHRRDDGAKTSAYAAIGNRKRLRLRLERVGPALVGCRHAVGTRLFCAIPNSARRARQALSDCVADCMQTRSWSVPSMLTAECGACTRRAFLAAPRSAQPADARNPTSSSCIYCRCENNCTRASTLLRAPLAAATATSGFVADSLRKGAQLWVPFLVSSDLAAGLGGDLELGPAGVARRLTASRPRR